MIRQVCNDDGSAIETETLRLAFSWDGQRWSHLLVIGQGGGRRSFADTFEQPIDGADASRVVSPTFQELHVQEEPGAILALLVGTHGPHHFSASFRVVEEDRDGRTATRVAVDVADRCRSPVAALASTYEVHDRRTSIVDGGPSRIAWRALVGDDEPFDVLLEPTAPGASLAIQPGSAAAQHVQILAPPTDEPTRRWSYAWTFARSG